MVDICHTLILSLSGAKRHGLGRVILGKKTLYQSSWDALEVKLVKTIMVVFDPSVDLCEPQSSGKS